MLNLNEFARQVHENAKKHGFWESKISDSELCCWLHAELAEAYEEYRWHRPMIWHDATGKPQGVAVELIDVCLMILDYKGAAHITFANEHARISDMIELIPERLRQRFAKAPLPEYLARMHSEIAGIFQTANTPDEFVFAFDMLCGLIFLRVEHEGLDPEAILLEKFHYNENRPYKHGR